MKQIDGQGTIYSEAVSLRAQFNELCEDAQHVVHQQLNSLVDLQGKVREFSEQLKDLPALVMDDVNLDVALQAKLNPAVQRSKSPNEQTSFSSMTNGDSGMPLKSESFDSPSSDGLSTEPLTNDAPMESNPNPLINTGPINDIGLNTALSENSYTTTEQLNSQLENTSNRDSIMDAERIGSSSTTVSIVGSTTESEPVGFESPVCLDSSPSITVESPRQSLDLTTNLPSSSNDNNPEDFDIGETEHILRRNIIRISTSNDKRVATIACHGNELFYNDYSDRTRKARLTLIHDFTGTMEKQIINWPEPTTLVGGGDDDWIQDIAYCDALKGYLLLNLSRLRLFRDDTREIEEFNQFPDRTMKRVTCNDSFIYLIIAGGVTSHHGDQVILMNYQKEEQVVKTFRDIITRRNNRSTGSVNGELSDIAVNNHGQVIFTYRCERYQEVGVSIYNVIKDGLLWTNVKSLLLNECWHSDLSFTPRIEWCEKLNTFILIEFLTSHLIMLDQYGQVKGERLFLSGDSGRDSPLNLTISNNDMLCIRYDTFINIHRLI